MQCQNCGHPNQVSARFCAKCITPLKENRAQLKSGDRVFMPPQNEYIVQSREARPRSNLRSSWWIVGLVIVLIVLFLVYG